MIGYDLQRPSHVQYAFRGCDLFECFVFVKYLAIPHELVKAKLDERTRGEEYALRDAIGRVVTTGGVNCCETLQSVERKIVNSGTVEQI
jgi:hypothetical protein